MVWGGARTCHRLQRLKLSAKEGASIRKSLTVAVLLPSIVPSFPLSPRTTHRKSLRSSPPVFHASLRTPYNFLTPSPTPILPLPADSTPVSRTNLANVDAEGDGKTPQTRRSRLNRRCVLRPKAACKARQSAHKFNTSLLRVSDKLACGKAANSDASFRLDGTIRRHNNFRRGERPSLNSWKSPQIYRSDFHQWGARYICRGALLSAGHKGATGNSEID